MPESETKEQKSYVPDQTNLYYVPQINAAMSWDFTEGNILDYGCGTGVTAHQLILPPVEATNSNLYAVDISPEIIQVAQKAFPHPRIQYKAGCFPDTFPFGDVKFDRIYSVNVFQFIKDLQSTLNSFKSILKPGGQIGFTCTTINCPVMEILERMTESPDIKEYLTECKKCLPMWSNYGEIEPVDYFRKTLMEDIGLKEVHFEFIKEEARFTTRKCLEIFLSMNSNVPENLLEDIRMEYRRLVERKLGAQVPESSSIPFPVEYICAVLEKPI